MPQRRSCGTEGNDALRCKKLIRVPSTAGPCGAEMPQSTAAYRAALPRN